MFLDNKYQIWYYKIINFAKCRKQIPEIIERHHIIPKSLGGDNSRENLVLLSPREHFICHLLLPKFTTGESRSKMCYATWALSNKKKSANLKITGRQYEIIKREFSKTHSISMTGRKHSEETKIKQRKPKVYENGKCSLLGKERTKNVKNKISSTLTGRVKSKEHVIKIGLSKQEKTIFKWHHPTLGVEICTIKDLMHKYSNLTICGLRHVKYGYQPTHRGWSMIKWQHG